MPEDRLAHATTEARRIERLGRSRFLRMHLVIRLLLIPIMLGVLALLDPDLITERVLWMFLGLQAVGFLLVAGMSGARLIDTTGLALSREQRREVSASLRRGAVPKDPELAAFALSHLRQMHRARWASVLLLLVAGWFFWMSRDYPGGHGVIDHIPTLVVLSAVPLAAWAEVTARRGRRVLAAYERAEGVEPV